MNWYAPVKRAVDLAGALVGVILAGPVVAVAALLIWLEDREASPFFHQERIGMSERNFRLLKLRTMHVARFDGERKLSDKERMLRTGGLFRKLSIDELPQLVNVLRGEMSFIGPRPMPVIYQPYFRPKERLRHSVRPGMSGLAQVSGRNFLSWDDKFALDVEYVRHFGLIQDLRIFFLTLWKLAVPSGVGTRGEDLPTQSLHEVREPWKEEAGV
jgi:lipopolysaccharide/colanic/teichoic acid biosynthesis glycosyltransferase